MIGDRLYQINEHKRVIVRIKLLWIHHTQYQLETDLEIDLSLLVMLLSKEHMFIPTISGDKQKKNKKNNDCSQMFDLPLTRISERTILKFGYSSASSIDFSNNSLRFIMFIKVKLGTGDDRMISELVSLIHSK